MALPPWFLVSMGGRCFQCLGPSLVLGSFGSSHQWRHKSQVSLRGPTYAHGVAATPYGEVRDKFAIGLKGEKIWWPARLISSWNIHEGRRQHMKSMVCMWVNFSKIMIVNMKNERLYTIKHINIVFNQFVASSIVESNVGNAFCCSVSFANHEGTPYWLWEHENVVWVHEDQESACVPTGQIPLPGKW